jgi:predicted MFS family arabinose efflux permease
MLPISLGGLLGDALLARFGYAAIFWTAFGFALLSLLLSLPLADRPRDPGEGEPARGFRAVALQRDLLPLWFIGAVFSIALAGVFVFVKLFVEETGLGTVGLFFTCYAAVALVLRVFFGWLPDRIGPKRVLFPALVTLALGFGMLAVAGDETDVAVAGALCGAGHGYTFPILFGMVVTRARDAERGAAMSIFTALFDAGVLLGGPLFGWTYGRRLTIEIASLGIYAHLERYTLVYAVGAGLLTLGALVYALLDRGREA